MTFYDWRILFNEIFEKFPDKWTLNYVHRNESKRIQLLQDHRKMPREKPAFFVCKRCLHHWPSAKAQVLFYYPNKEQPLGKVTMQVFGQQCRKCIQKTSFYADPIFNLNIISQILEQLYERIDQDCYNKPRPRKKKAMVDSWCDTKGEHESNLCEACKLNICSYKKNTHR